MRVFLCARRCLTATKQAHWGVRCVSTREKPYYIHDIAWLICWKFGRDRSSNWNTLFDMIHSKLFVGYKIFYTQFHINKRCKIANLCRNVDTAITYFILRKIITGSYKKTFIHYGYLGNEYNNKIFLNICLDCPFLGFYQVSTQQGLRVYT